MAITVDASTEHIRDDDPDLYNHAGAASGVKGVIVGLAQLNSSADIVTAVTYGGSALTRLISATDTSSEVGRAELWFLGSAVPQGTQEVSITGAGAAIAWSNTTTLLADANLESIDTDFLSENQTDPSVTLNYGGRSAMSFAAMFSGHNSEASVTPNGNCSTVNSASDGSRSVFFIRQTTAGTSDFAIGVTAALEDCAFAAAAISETSGTDTPLTVDKADIQPSGSAVALTSLMALSAASFGIDGQVIALQWQQDTLTISVDAAAITLAPQPIDGRRGIPVLTGAPTIAGQTILFQLSSGDWTVPVDTGSPTILGEDIVLEDNRFFVRGAPTLSPSTIVLSENAVVVSAAPSFTGSDITLTWGQASVGVETASFSIQGQSVVLSKTWSLAVDSASFDIDGQNIVFDWVVPSTVVVEPALFSVAGGGFVLDRHIDFPATLLSPTGQSIGRGDGTIVSPALFSINPQNVEFEYDYILGYAFDPAEFQILGKDVVLYLGTGAPTRVRSVFTKDRIQIAFSIPQTYKTTASERIRG